MGIKKNALAKLQGKKISVEKIKNYAIITVIAGGTIYGINYAINKAKQRKAEKELANDPNGIIATKINSAIRGAGTDEEVLYAIAEQITDFKSVTTAYRKLYLTSLLDDLQGDLNPEEYSRFIDIINRVSSDENQAPKNYYVVTNASVYIRRTPEKKWLLSWSRNIIKGVDADMIVGVSEGIDIYDKENDVVFTKMRSVAENETTWDYFTYAWKGALDFLTPDQVRERFHETDLQVIFKTRLQKFNKIDLTL